MKTGKRKIGVISLGLILGLVLGINPIYALDFDKEEMDVVLREELRKIDDIELRQAILDEYKEILMENMPELDIEEATCQDCEEDIEMLEKGKVNVVIIDADLLSKDNESITESQTEITSSAVETAVETSPEPEVDPGPIEVDPDPVEIDPDPPIDVYPDPPEEPDPVQEDSVPDLTQDANYCPSSCYDR